MLKPPCSPCWDVLKAKMCSKAGSQGSGSAGGGGGVANTCQGPGCG